MASRKKPDEIMEGCGKDMGDQLVSISGTVRKTVCDIKQGEESSTGEQGAGLPVANVKNMRLYDGTGVPLRCQDFRPSESKSSRWTEIYNAIKSNLNNGPIYSICGKRGCGKTQLGCCLIGCVVTSMKRSAQYCKAQDIFLRIREAMRGEGDSERAAIKEMVTPYLLVIDAFEVRGDSQFENRMMDHIIDKRYDAMLATIVISNDKPEVLSSALGQSIMDRIAQTGGMIEMDGESFRRIC